MATRIIHFGVDELGYVPLLVEQEYEVLDCGTSVPTLMRALSQSDFAALAVSESQGSIDEELLKRARSARSVPFILFQNASATYETHHFDFVIPPGTPHLEWLKKTAELIERSRALHQQSASLKEESAARQHEAAATRHESAALRERSAAARHRSAAVLQQTGAVRTLLVDDYEPWRHAIREMLGSRTDLQIVAEAADGIEAVQKATELKPDLILLDNGLPRLNGIEAAKQIHQTVPNAAIIFLSQENNPAVMSEALRSGAMAYVVKANAARELDCATDAILRGKRFVSGREEQGETIGVRVLASPKT